MAIEETTQPRRDPHFPMMVALDTFGCLYSPGVLLFLRDLGRVSKLSNAIKIDNHESHLSKSLQRQAVKTLLSKRAPVRLGIAGISFVYVIQSEIIACPLVASVDLGLRYERGWFKQPLE